MVRMDDGPTIYTIPRYLTQQAARLRRAAFLYVFIVPVAIWLPVGVGLHGVRAVVVGGVGAAIAGALLQLAPRAAPHTLRRRYRRLTGQAALIAAAAFAALALLRILRDGLLLVALGTIAMSGALLAFLLISLPIYLVPHPEDVQRP